MGRIRGVHTISNLGNLLRRAATIYRSNGPVSLVRVGYRFTLHWLELLLLTAFYAVRYGKTAPRAGEQLHVDPARIEYVMSKKRLPDDVPPFGVIPGPWDRTKLHRFEYGEMWNGLIERYGEEKAWPETRYYQTGMERLANGETLRVLDVEDPSVEDFEEYMSYLDEIYESIRTEGYDESATIPVNIGRDGEFILYADGNHRTTIAQAAEVESIPVNIVYRHEKWQQIRREVETVDTYEALSESARAHLDHPDVQKLKQTCEGETV